MARGQSKEDSVYDFFYVDSHRIGVLLSQFGEDGILTELTRATDLSGESGGGINIQIAKYEGKESSKTSLGKRFDPQWLMPLLFLDAAQDWIKRDFQKAGMGQLVLISGDLSVRYTKLLQNIWALDSTKKTALQSLDLTLETHRPNASEQEKEKARLATEASMEMISVMPHQTQAVVSFDKKNFWSTLIDDFVIGGVANLPLKHGPEVSGTWSMVGILDALPDTVHVEKFPPLADVLNTDNPEFIRKMLKSVMQSTRNLLGRPPEMYGITPLLIFREILK